MQIFCVCVTHELDCMYMRELNMCSLLYEDFFCVQIHEKIVALETT